MSQKRKYGDTTNGPSKKFRPFKPVGSSDAPHKRKRPQIKHDSDSGPSIHALKSRIRDLKRLLAHVDHVGDHKMSASTRIERERELEACEHELEEKIEGSREAAYRQKMIGKYHQVRFFDRQKATRILKRLKKEHAAEEDEEKKAELRRRVHNAEIDVNYAIYYPLMKPYSSMYPKSKKDKPAGASDDDSDAQGKSSKEVDGPKGDLDMWRKVEVATEEGTLDALRNSKEGIPAAPKKEQTKKPFVKPKATGANLRVVGGNRRERRAQVAQQQEEENDSDGGFFE
ncbi:hypothetical protein IAQ61_011031 [Plenodomus lingam]|uniref:rRNA-processing protein EFG1 n=1 Tax=Leptosphaeria maculans (strain JN3 / isolate v23.1.3 / race Av1-4-5-6-7-8) TaxID=985895 RepID=E4ZKE0_LEPMJ|nr:similar to nuclear protein involved in pre-rRNA processing [Plenodomus lingam JN3]KAH9861294.1 hypothetical protein IAQ61_011031 [Plenodomus lingam]CBX91735.1 similar to nuclear protein involved in pre-rRNA processing [Plenodomus lingam JN3]